MTKRTKTMKKVTLVIVSTFMLVLMLGMTTLASEAALKKLKFGNTTTVQKTDRAAFKDYKITVNRRSWIGFDGVGVMSNGMYTTLRVDILNSKKRKINSSSVTVHLEDDYYAQGMYLVNKGTYYLRVTASNPFVFNYATAGIKENSGAKRSKAKTLSRKKARVGIIGINEKKNAADWYKIVLKKPAKPKFQVASLSSKSWDGVKVEITSQSKVVRGTVLLRATNERRSTTLQLQGNKRLPAGTYYVKVSRGTTAKGRDALYSVYWK